MGRAVNVYDQEATHNLENRLFQRLGWIEVECISLGMCLSKQLSRVKTEEYESLFLHYEWIYDQIIRCVDKLLTQKKPTDEMGVRRDGLLPTEVQESIDSAIRTIESHINQMIGDMDFFKQDKILLEEFMSQWYKRTLKIVAKKLLFVVERAENLARSGSATR